MSAIQEPGFVQKLGRANEHRETLDALMDAFVRDNPCSVEKEFDTDSKKRRWRVTAEPPDANELWTPIFGEFFFNARSALDQLFYATLRKFGGPSTHELFPIFEDPVEFLCRMSKPLKKVPSDVVTLIEASQPYNGPIRPDRHSLSLLNKLCNLDKHKRPHLSVYAIEGGTSRGELPKGIFPFTGRVKKGTILFEFVVTTPEQMDVNFTPIFKIAFAEGGADYASAHQVMFLISNSVQRIIDAIKPFL